jgi:hypothetical protein
MFDGLVSRAILKGMAFFMPAQIVQLLARIEYYNLFLYVLSDRFQVEQHPAGKELHKN